MRGVIKQSKLTKRPKEGKQEDRNQIDGDAPICEEESRHLLRLLLDILVLEKLQNGFQRVHFDHSKLGRVMMIKVHIRVATVLSGPRFKTAKYSRMLA